MNSEKRQSAFSTGESELVAKREAVRRQVLVGPSGRKAPSQGRHLHSTPTLPTDVLRLGQQARNRRDPAQGSSASDGRCPVQNILSATFLAAPKQVF